MRIPARDRESSTRVSVRVRRAILQRVLFTTLVSCSGTVNARVGLSGAEFKRVYGKPLTWGESAPGTVVATFRKDGIDVAAGIVEGVVRRITYRQAGMQTATVESLLASNRQGRRWHVWSVPGRRRGPSDTRSWMRSDEMVMAHADKGSLTVVSADWNRRFVARKVPRGPAKTAPPVKAKTAVPSPGAPSVTGYWVSRARSGEAIGLHFKRAGKLSWVVYGEDERQEFRMAYRDEPCADGTRDILMRAETTSKTPGGATLGRFRFRNGNTLVCHPHLPKNGARSMLADWCGNGELVFERRAALPRWAPQAPSCLPVAGDTREEALKLIGLPLGIVRAGQKETMQYAWGSLQFLGGELIQVSYTVKGH